MFVIIFIALLLSRNASAEFSDLACGPNAPLLLTKYIGTINSPGYSENETYDEGLHCQWIIHSQEGYNIRITFNEVDLDEVNSCNGDSITISTHDGLVKQICGKSKPNDILVTNNTVIIEFQSDYLFSGKGFSLTYKFTSKTTLCNQNDVQCINRNCVSFRKLCDGKDDCGDDSDEMYCRKFEPAETFACGETPIEPQINGTLKIVGGFAAVEGSWPWQADIQVNFIEPNGHICGGTLIHQEFVLTAAHCFMRIRDRSHFRIIFGNYDRFKTNGHEQVRYIKNYVIYPSILDEDYATEDELTFDVNNDIALIKLSSPVKITERVQMACLPSQGFELSMGTKCFATGWGETQGTGSSNVLKQLPMFVAHSDKCKPLEDDYGDEYSSNYNETKICMSSEAHENGLCSGDSGGPLVYKSDKWYLIGITSHLIAGSVAGPICAIQGFGETFAKVSPKVEWIRESMQFLNNQ